MSGSAAAACCCDDGGSPPTTFPCDEVSEFCDETYACFCDVDVQWRPCDSDGTQIFNITASSVITRQGPANEQWFSGAIGDFSDYLATGITFSPFPSTVPSLTFEWRVRWELYRSCHLSFPYSGNYWFWQLRFFCSAFTESGDAVNAGALAARHFPEHGPRINTKGLPEYQASPPCPEMVDFLPPACRHSSLSGGGSAVWPPKCHIVASSGHARWFPGVPCATALGPRTCPPELPHGTPNGLVVGSPCTGMFDFWIEAI